MLAEEKENVTEDASWRSTQYLLSSTECQHQEVSTMVYTVIPTQLLQKT